MLGIGVLLPAAASAQVKPDATPPTPQKRTELSPDLAFGRSIALIRGHLRAGDELVKQHQWNVAYPHFTYPTEEIYGVIREELRAYHTPPFDSALKALARTVRAHSTAQYPKALEKVDKALAAAGAGLKARQPDWPRFTVAVAVEVLKTAANEYDDAVADDRVVHAVVYRTARGFLLQADSMIESEASDLGADNATALADIRSTIAQLKSAFTTLNIPDRPPITVSEFLAAVSQIDVAAGKLTPMH